MNSESKNWMRAAPHLGFASNDLDRRSEKRSETSLDEARSHPDARFLLHSPPGFLCRTIEGLPDPVFERPAAEAFVDLCDQEAVLLGNDPDDRPVLAFEVEREFSASGAIAAVDLRSLVASGVLAPAMEGRLAQARHLLLWHRENHFCGRCAGTTVNAGGGVRRICTRCEQIIFPRINPVAIMLVHDGEGRCLLGRQPHFATGMWSCLAGFVEAGETLEAAVRRETLEEAGIRVGEVDYRCSQPWPFSGNLMLGACAKALSFDVRYDTEELEACRWFERSEVASMLAGEHPDGLKTPQPLAIAHHLIRAYVLDGR